MTPTYITASAGTHKMRDSSPQGSQDSPHLDAPAPTRKPHSAPDVHPMGMQDAPDRDEPEDDNPDALQPFRVPLGGAIESLCRAIEERAGSDDQ